jgi:NAD-dependent SIR2 family protein deacetylase
VRKAKLRPNIRLFDETDSDLPEDIVDLEHIPDVLLVVGTSLKTELIENVVKVLASSLHTVGRRVIHIGLEKLARKAWGNQVDVCLQLDVQEWARRQLAAFKSQGSIQLNGHEMLESVSNGVQPLSVRIDETEYI